MCRITLKFSKLLAIVALVCPAWGVGAQVTTRLNSWKYLADIRADLNQLFNYNQYEGMRWGLGLQATYPFRYDPSHARDQQNGWRIKGYAAYGTLDKALKGGASADIILPRFPLRSAGISVCHDLDQAGSRQLGSYHLLQTYDNTNYVCSKYIGVDRLEVGIGQLHHRGNDILMRLRLSREDYRFDRAGLVYPRRGDASMPHLLYVEGMVGVRYAFGLSYRLLAGHVRSDDPRMEPRAYATLLTQYANVLTPRHGRNDQLFLYAQCGLATLSSPFGRYFDLSGTAGSHYFFRNSFLTVFPDAFHSNAFLAASVHYLWGRPLWDLKWSSPQPFLQLGGLVGWLRGSNHEGALLYSLRQERPMLPTSTAQIGEEQVLALHAPTRGLLEPAVGVTRVVRLRWLEVGAALAYQLTPSKADYHRQGWRANMAWAVVASMTLN